MRVAMPWVWGNLCSAITVLDGSLRDWAIGGQTPSTNPLPTNGRDARGGQILTFTGSAVGQKDFTNNGLHTRPTNAVTMFCRFRSNGVNTGAAGVFAKVWGATTPFDSYAIIVNNNASNTTSFQGVVQGDTSGVPTNLGSALFANLWLRWQSPGTPTLDNLRDDGTIAAAQLLGASALTGPITYTLTQPLRVGGDDAPTRASAGGDWSLGMVWDRRLSDQEMYAVTFDPFGWIRRA